MISWHKPGQKITPKRCEECPLRHARSLCVEKPSHGEVVTISKVMILLGVVCFLVEEFPGIFAAGCMSPVYPTEVENLKRLCVTPPTKVTEDA